MQRKSAFERIEAVIVVGLLLAGCAPAAGRPAESTAAPTATVSEALRRDAELMAEEMGISVEEAIRRASLQDLIGNLNAELEQREAATFAGLWIQNEPEYRVVVAFTRDGKETLRPYVENTPLAELIEIRTAGASLAELIAAEQEANRLVQELGLPFSTAIDVEGNRVELLVTDRPQFEAALRNANWQLPERVELIVLSEPPVQAPAGITPVPDVAFPQLRARSTVHFDIGPLQGMLFIKDGCLRVSKEDKDAGCLIIWQPDYFLSNNRGIVEVLDREGSVVARVGEQVSLTAAGETDWESKLRQPLPDQCPGPTWVMDGIVRK